MVPKMAKRRTCKCPFLNWQTPNTAGKQMGWMSDKDWKTVETLGHCRVTTPLKASDLYTNDLVSRK